MDKPLVFKISCKDDTRRISLEATPSYVDFVSLVRRLFQLEASEDLTFKYEDDEKDQISITSDLELKEAIKFSQSTKQKVVRLFLVRASKEEASQKRLQDEKRRQEEEKRKQEEEEKRKQEELRQQELLARKVAEEEARKRFQEEKRLRREQEEQKLLEQKRKLEEEKRKLEEEAKRKADEEKRKQEEERRKLEEERRRLEEEALRRAEEQKRKQEEERRKLEEEKRKLEEDARRKQEELQRKLEEEKRKLEEEAKRKAEEIARLQEQFARQLAQEEAQKAKLEIERRKKEEEEASKKLLAELSKPPIIREYLARNGERIKLDISKNACMKFGVEHGTRVDSLNGPGTVVGVDLNRGHLWFKMDSDTGISFWDDIKDYDSMLCKGITLLAPEKDRKIPYQKKLLVEAPLNSKSGRLTDEELESQMLERAIQESLIDQTQQNIRNNYIEQLQKK